jgi:hypothetical protein
LRFADAEEASDFPVGAAAEPGHDDGQPLPIRHVGRDTGRQVRTGDLTRIGSAKFGRPPVRLHQQMGAERTPVAVNLVLPPPQLDEDLSSRLLGLPRAAHHAGGSVDGIAMTTIELGQRLSTATGNGHQEGGIAGVEGVAGLRFVQDRGTNVTWDHRREAILLSSSCPAFIPGV